MATTTPNYGWTVPTSTDLVKDGATAIETLGDAIDASMNTALGTKKAGMVLLNTTSFSAVASQSINDVFSATYDSYRILFNCTTTTVGDIQLRFRVSGADNTTSNYGSVSFIANNGTARTQQADQNLAIILSAQTSTSHKGISMDVIDPFSSTKKTKFQGTTSGIGAGVTDNQSGFTGGGFNANTSFTGLTYFVSAGSFTGTVQIYGYNQ
jgi:hypothetical protein